MSRLNQKTSVSALLGAPVLDSAGQPFGRVREFAVAPLVDASRVYALVLRRSGAHSRRGESFLAPISALERKSTGELWLTAHAGPAAMLNGEEYLLLDRDLLDQQIIDIHGHKVVRVNDVDLVWESAETPGERLILRIAEVEVGTRGALRRLLKGLPQEFVDRVSCQVRPSIIPWDFVDLIDRDPARRVRLKVEQDKLARMHPSDLADILEDLAPMERQALFSSLDEEVAAEALEETDLKTQKNLIESIDSERLAGIIEEMDPGAAAHLLSELSDERSDAILEEMGEKERHDVEELLDYEQDSAAGLMTSEYLAVGAEATVADVFHAMEQFEGDLETVTDVFLLNADRHVVGVVPLARLMLTPRETPLQELHEGHLVCSQLGASGRKVAEQFDKYNLRCLPVLDEGKRLAGVIHAEKVIAWLRAGK